MLQHIREGVGRWVAIAILGLIAVTFIFFGVDLSTIGTTFAARVNGEPIPLLEFERALQAQQAEYADLYRMEFTEDLQQELRVSVLERLVRNEALLQRAEAAGYGVSDAQLSAAIRERAEFQVDGEFSIDLYRARLLSEGMPPTAFEALLRDQLELIELQTGIANSAFFTPTEYRRYIELYNQRREVGYANFVADAFVDEVEVSEEAMLEHFEANAASFQTEESVDLEYIEVLGEELAAEVEVTEDALLAYYEEEQERFVTEEQRRARHILFTGDDAETRAQDAMGRLEAGEDFETLAMELSDDPGTSAQGGDLGWVGRGLLVGPFEDTLYAMELGAVEGPIETGFGFHVIRLDEINAGDVQPFELVREELAEELRLRESEDGFYTRATELADRAFDAFDELATVATQMELPLQSFAGFTRSGTVSPFADSAAVVQAAFSPEVLELGQNSGPIELTDDHVLVLRVAAHHPPTEQSFEAVREEVEQALIRAEAERLAADAAQAFIEESSDAQEDLEALAVSLGGEWNPPTWIQRTDSTLPAQLVATAYRLGKPQADAPITEPVPLASGDFAVLLLANVEPGDPDAVTDEERDTAARQLTDQAAMFELTGYAGEIRDDATVRIPDQVLNPIF
jgi:peptidyl-prolyl cis-trans isomerase D